MIGLIQSQYNAQWYKQTVYTPTIEGCLHYLFQSDTYILIVLKKNVSRTYKERRYWLLKSTNRFAGRFSLLLPMSLQKKQKTNMTNFKAYNIEIWIYYKDTTNTLQRHSLIQKWTRAGTIPVHWYITCRQHATQILKSLINPDTIPASLIYW